MDLTCDGFDGLRTGIEEMDRQHLAISRMVARLQAAPRATDSDARDLHALVESVSAHFAWEDSEMDLSGYPDRSRHAKDHRLQLANLRALLKSVETGAEPLDQGFFLACANWLERHILSLDAEFASYLADREIWDLRRELDEWEFEDRMAALPD